jgi:CMP-N-acetylneuraminic acid synthetase
MFLKAWNILQNVSSADSVRAVELCHEHPGKMWTIKGELMEPLLDQEGQKTPWYDGQYQALPKVYVQNSSLEIAWTRVVEQCGTRGGVHIAPLLTEKYEGFSIDYEEDWILGEMLVKQGKAVLPHIEQKPYAG